MTVSDKAGQTLPHARAWTENSIPEGGKRCDRCKRWRLHARYHEFHGERTEAEVEAGALEGCWWRECMDCSFTTVGDLASEYRASFLKTLGEELEAQS